MCHISKAIEPSFFERDTRSVRVNGYVTSMGLEEQFWLVIERLADTQQMSVSQLLAVLYDEYTRSGIATSNFTSFLRVSCIEAVREQQLPVSEHFRRAHGPD